MVRTARWCVYVFLVLSIAPLAAPAAAKKAQVGKITGQASYRERVGLSPNAVLEVTLEDASQGATKGDVVARVRKMNPGQVPIQFELPYTPRRIDSHRTYVVRANIRDGGRVRFTSDRAHPVLTKGHGATVAIMMSGAQAIGGWGEGSVQPGPAPPLKVPATYAGLLPCADCSGIRYQVNLLPNGAYMQRATYLRDGHDDSYYEVGAWSRSKDGYTLTLEADRKARAFWEVKSSQTLRKLDTQGRRID